MKRMVFILIMLHCFSSIAHAAIFQQGDRGTFSFSSLPYIGSEDSSYMDTTWIHFPPPTVIFRLDGTSEFIPFLTPGDSFQINLFEDNADLIPSRVELIRGLDGTTGIGFMNFPSYYIDGTASYGDLLWEDLEGKLTLTMLTGSMDLDFLNVEVHAGGQVWGQSFEVSVVPTPIPAAAWLLGSGLLGLVGLRKKIRKC
ncbi:MAG: hypothetical protein KKA54_18760 [Proteobacteria bacterium]|nr:hypothetical protein [Pseudomonadota bacterium]